MKYIPILLSLVLLLGVLPGVVAEDYEDEVIASGEVEILSEDEIQDIAQEDLEGLEELTEDERDAFFRITQVTTGRGFVLKDDESDAEFFHGLWAVRRLIESSDDATSVSDATVKERRFGYVVIGVGDSKERFKLEKQNSSADTVLFSLSKDGTIVGKMELKPKRYERITLWFGSLTVDAGRHSGEWSVTAAAKTRIIKPKIERPSGWNIFAFRQRREAAIKEEVQEKLLEREGLGELAKATLKNKDFEKVPVEQRTVEVDRVKRIQEKYAVNARAKTVDARGVDVTTAASVDATTANTQ